jgi:cytochrome P450
MTDIDVRPSKTAQPQPAQSPQAQLPVPPASRLPLAVQSVLFARARHLWLPRLRRRYGDIFTVRIFPNRHVTQIADPELIRQVFAGPVDIFHAGEGNQVLAPIMGEHSVLTTDEKEHHRLRKLLMPPFHGSALRGYREMVAELAEQDAAGWPTGTPFAVHQRMQALTLEIIIRVVFGVAEGPRLDELRSKLGVFVEFGLLTMIGLSQPTLLKLPLWRRSQRLLAEIDEAIFAEIDERSAAPDLEERSDVLSRMLTVKLEGDQLTRQEVRDQLITLLLAGHETTATALAWTFHELARDPALQRRAQEAARTGDSAYLEAVAKEAMRLHPVIYEVMRTVTEDVELGGYRIPAGHTVAPVIGIVQSDPANHREPERFDPERFLDGSARSSVWLPFGGGARRCLGAGFALMEAVEVLRVVLGRFELSLVPGGRAERPRPRNITFTPAHGARIVARQQPGTGRATP